MPNRKTHCDLSKILFGESGSKIHKFMDTPIKQLGRNHRGSQHNSRMIAFLFATKGKKAAQHALSHIILDKSISSSKTTVEKLVSANMQKTLKKIKQIKGLK